MRRDGSDLRLVVEHRHLDRYPGNVSWARDSRTIAFETSPNFDCTAIYLVDVASGKSRPLTSCTNRSDSALSPSWQRAGS